MNDRDALPGQVGHGALGWARVAALVIVIVGWGPVMALGQPLDPSRVVSTSAASKEAEPDVFDRIGRWFDDTFTDRRPAGKPDLETSGSAGAATPPLGLDIITQRQKCEPAANGAPDCPRAAELACRSRGYTTGTSLQTQSERVCSPPPLFPQQGQRPSGCRTEAYVLRAICQ
jgi:hypothetical protein